MPRLLWALREHVIGLLGEPGSGSEGICMEEGHSRQEQHLHERMKVAKSLAYLKNILCAEYQN